MKLIDSNARPLMTSPATAPLRTTEVTPQVSVPVTAPPADELKHRKPDSYAIGQPAEPATESRLPEALPEPELKPVSRLNSRFSTSVIANANFVQIGKTQVLLDLRRVSLGNPMLLRDLNRDLQRLDNPRNRQEALDFSAQTSSLVDSIRHGGQAVELPIAPALRQGPARVFQSLEAALADTQKHSGTQALMQLPDKGGKPVFAVVDLSKAGLEASDLLAGQSGTVLLMGEDQKLQILSQGQPTPEQELDLAKALSDLVQADRAGGFDRSRAGTQEAGKMPVYQHNLSTVLTYLNQLPSSTDARVLQTILQSKLQLLPVSTQSIPGTEQVIGVHRKDFAKTVEFLQNQLAGLDAEWAATTEPVALERLEGLKGKLQQEITTAINTGLRIEQANISLKMRVGSLAAILDVLAATPEQLETQLGDYSEMLARMDPQSDLFREGFEADPKVMHKQLDTRFSFDRGGMFRQLARNTGAIESWRGYLTATLQTQRKSFAKYAPREGGKIAPGAQKTLDLLDHLVIQLKDSGDKASVLKVMHTTRSSLLAAVKQAGSDWAGISPKEARLMATIDSGLQTYLADYDQILDELGAFEAELEDKRGLLIIPPESPISQTKLSQYQQAYVKRTHRLIDAAKPGTKLEKLKLLLQSLQMLTSPNTLKKVVDQAVSIDEVKRRITELGEDPEIKSYFEGIQAGCLRTTFGRETMPAQIQADYLLSRDFQDYLSVLSPELSQQTLKRELDLLGSMDEKLLQSVSEELFGVVILDRSHELLADLPPEAREAAITAVLKDIDDIYNKTASRPLGISSAVAGALNSMTREEIRATGSTGRLLDKVITRLEGMKTGKKALEYLKEVKQNGKLGALGAAFGLVGLGAKFPPADFKGLVDFSSSSITLLSSGSDVCKVFNTLPESRVTRAFAVLETYGPVGDLLGMAVGGADAFNEFRYGDNFGGAMKVGGVLSTGIGALATAGLVGGPVLLISATVAGAAFWLADTLLAESDQQTLLKRAGLLKA
jgi:hypothetical protein